MIFKNAQVRIRFKCPVPEVSSVSICLLMKSLIVKRSCEAVGDMM